ncbi:hypothetical protein HKD37_04G010340 [Glycine soja]
MSFVVYKSKGERKDIELVEEEEPRIGADCSSATSNKSEIYKEEAGNAAQKHKAKRVESVNADAKAFDWSMHSEAEALEHMKKRDTGHQSVSLENKTGDSTVLKIGDSDKVVIKQDMKGGEHKYRFNNNKHEKPEKIRVVDDETSDKHELYERTRKASRLRSLSTRPPGAERPVVHVDPATGKADGPHRKKLRTYLGIVVRDKVDVTYENWKEVPTAHKDLIWEDIQAEFEILEASDSRMKRKLLQTVGERWRQFKSDLTRKWLIRTVWRTLSMRNMALARKNRPSFARLAETLLGRMCAKRHRSSRSRTLPPTFCLVGKLLAEKTKKKLEEAAQSGSVDGIIDPPSPVRCHVKWKMARTKKTGEMTTEAAKEIDAKIDSFEEQATQGSFVPHGRQDVLTAAIGRPEHPGRVRAAGAGVTIKQYFGLAPQTSRSSSSLPPEELQQLTQQIRDQLEESITERMQSQGLALPPKPLVGPSGPRVSTKGSCVDPSGNDPETGDSDRCGLYIEADPETEGFMTPTSSFKVHVFSPTDGNCGRHLQIMVKTRGLGCALGRVVARGLGRGDGDDSHGAPQRRRPTTSARRRRVPILIDDVVPAVPADSPTVPEAEANVAGDEPMVDAVAQDTGAETDAQDTSAQDAADEPEGFPGGPRDPSVLTEYADHVAASVWSGQEHPELKLSSHGRKVNNLGRLVPAIEDMVAGTGLSPLIARFRSRWMTLRLFSIYRLLAHSMTSSLYAAMRRRGGHGRDRPMWWTICTPAVAARCIPAQMSDATIDTRVHVIHLQALCDLTLVGRLSWIYEHFASVAKCNADPDYDEVSPRACQWIETKKTVKKVSTATHKQCLDRLRIPDFHWEPVVVRYRPKRVMRQFGYVQCIPTHPVHSWVSYDDVDNTWTHYSDHLAAAGDLCVVLGQCAPDYIDWFFIISHPFMTAPQTDPPRDAYATQPSHIPHEAAPASTHADPDADEPRHAVACHAIAEALEQHLNASGTSTHEEVIQKCLRISRGVTEDRNVYVRSRRR